MTRAPADLALRMHALIDEVTDELMREPSARREACRADAIALLIAAAMQPQATPEPPQSPLLYLLQEEHQKALACVAPDARPAELLLRA